MRHNILRLQIVDGNNDLMSNEANRTRRIQESLRRLQELGSIPLTDMGAVNARLNAHEAGGHLLPGFFETSPEDIHLFREGEE